MLGVGLLLGGYYLFQNIIKLQSVQQSNITNAPSPQHAETKGNLEQKRKGADIPEGQKPFFGKVISVKGSILTIQSIGTTETLTVKLDKTTIYSGGKQSDINNEVKVAGIGKTNSDGSITAVKLEIKPTTSTR